MKPQVDLFSLEEIDDTKKTFRNYLTDLYRDEILLIFWQDSNEILKRYPDDSLYRFWSECNAKAHPPERNSLNLHFLLLHFRFKGSFEKKLKWRNAEVTKIGAIFYKIKCLKHVNVRSCSPDQKLLNENNFQKNHDNIWHGKIIMKIWI